MITHVPVLLSALFILVTIAALLIFHWILRSPSTIPVKNANAISTCLILWLTVQGVLSLKKVYDTQLTALPPRLFILGIFPTLAAILWLFLSRSGRVFMDRLALRRLIWLNVVRIPVEIGLFWLYLSGAVPKLMTFEGGNLDIISGLSAPVIAYYAFRKRLLGHRLVLAWNFLCLGFLANIFIRAIVSAPFPFQKLGFDQPNIAILNFPFVWLPTFIVPIVLFGQLASVRQLLRTDRLHY